MMTSKELETQMATVLDALRREFAGIVPAERVTAVGRYHFERLRLDASVPDFVPLLAHRLAKEDLLSGTTHRLDEAA
jgi:hypothetical protein